MKLFRLCAVPAAVVTWNFPEVAPTGTVTRSCDPFFTLKRQKAPPRVTAVVPSRFFPLRVMRVPGVPLCGENDLTFGTWITTNLVALSAVPSGVFTVIFPVEVSGTVAVIMVSEVTVNLADLPWNSTFVAPMNRLPRTVTTVP